MKTKYKKNNIISRLVSKGPERAPHRSYYYAMGLKEKEINRPFVGVVSTWNEAAPCNISLMGQTKFVKKGVTEAGGTPREFTTITVTDGIAMGHPGMKSSLVSREVIADSVELTVRGHCYDAIVGVAGCDKSLPGLMMVMARLNLPSIFMYGGSILPGKFKGQQVTVQDLFEASAELRTNNAPAPYYGVFHPKQIFNVKKSLTNTFAGLNTELSNEAMRSGFVGQIAGIEIFESSNISVDGSDDSIGGVFSQDALALAMMQDLKIESQRDASLRADEIVATAVYGVGEIHDTYGVKLTADSVAS